MAQPLSLDCHAIVIPGAEQVAAAELAALGIRPSGIESGGVGFLTDRAGLYAANLQLRSVSRVIVRIATFRASSFHQLERHAKRVPWRAYLGTDTAVWFRITSRKSRLYHQGAIEQRLLEAIGNAARIAASPVDSADADADANADVDVSADVDADAAPVGAPPAEEQAVGQGFVVRVFRDEFTISVDSSGELLHRRGYRLATAKAPLRETLAATLVLASGWDGRAPLLDPMCGSGTIPIEAALIARRIAPGLNRAFAFERWPDFDLPLWRDLVAKARERVLGSVPAPVLGSDRDAGAIVAARANAERAGVLEDVQLECRALSAIEPPEEPGIVVSNPPYGGRIGDRRRLRDLYAQLGHTLRRRCPGWQVALLSAHADLLRETKLPLDPLLALSNGGIRVRLALGTVPGHPPVVSPPRIGKTSPVI